MKPSPLLMVRILSMYGLFSSTGLFTPNVKKVDFIVGEQLSNLTGGCESKALHRLFGKAESLILSLNGLPA